MFNKIKNLDNKYYMPCFNRQNLCIERGEGAVLYDTSDKSYIDFVAGIAVNCLGYNHPKLVEAISTQAAKLIHISNVYYNEPQARLIEALVKKSIFDRVFLSNSGAEANECAVKLIRKYFYWRGEKRFKIVTATGSFHGRTMATLTLTGQPKYADPYVPLLPEVEYVPFNDIAALKAAVDGDTAAVIMETIQGENGVIVADGAYLIDAYALCKAKGALFVLDEVQTGVGRTGKMFSFEHFGIQPDIVTLAKGLGGGVPIGATLARGEVAKAFKAGDHGSTFGGNPLASSAAGVVIDLLTNTDLLKEIERKGEYFRNKLRAFKKYKWVKEVRGMGLMLGIELEPELNGPEIVGKLMTKGFLVNCAGNNTLRFVPPYIISEAQIDQLYDALEDIFSKTNL
ncbi:MAG: acetylornithine transaminase [Firmicutes bacterium]|nr:acetylornithine transaminase [Bacillota bacterium]